MGIVPGDDPGRKEEPLLADEPLPPGVEDFSVDVDALEKRIRERGPDEVKAADQQADAVEGGSGEQPGGASDDDGRPGAKADAGQDPTSDEGADAEDPEAQHGAGPAGGDPD